MTVRGWSVPDELGMLIEEQLAGVVDPCSTASVVSMSIVELGLVPDVSLDQGVLTVHLRLTSPSCMMVGYIAREVEERLSGLEGVGSVVVQPDAGLDWDPSMMDPHVARERGRRLTLLRLSDFADDRSRGAQAT